MKDLKPVKQNSLPEILFAIDNYMVTFIKHFPGKVIPKVHILGQCFPHIQQRINLRPAIGKVFPWDLWCVHGVSCDLAASQYGRGKSFLLQFVWFPVILWCGGLYFLCINFEHFFGLRKGLYIFFKNLCASTKSKSQVCCVSIITVIHNPHLESWLNGPIFLLQRMVYYHLSN